MVKWARGSRGRTEKGGARVQRRLQESCQKEGTGWGKREGRAADGAMLTGLDIKAQHVLRKLVPPTGRQMSL